MAKHYFFVLLLLTIPFSVFSQNYAPVHPNRTYVYQYTQSGIGLERYRVQTDWYVQGLDTIFTLNTVVDEVSNQNIDTTNCLGASIPAPIYQMDHPNKFGQRLIHHANGNWTWILQSGDAFALQVTAPVGQSWPATLNISGSITAIVPANNFGIQDSVMLISFSNGASLVISKALGLASTPNPQGLNFSSVSQQWELVNIPEIPVGDGNEFEDIFNFDVGDRFGWQMGTLSPWSGGSTIVDGFFSNWEILSKYESPNRDTFRYEIARQRLEIRDAFISSVDTAILHPMDTITEVYVKANFQDLLGLPSLGAERTPNGAQSPVRLWDRPHSSFGSRLNARFHTSVISDTCHNYLYNYFDANGYQEYTVGLGFTRGESYSLLDGIRELLCYTKGSESNGTCIDFGAYVSVDPGQQAQARLNLTRQGDLLYWDLQNSLPGGSSLILMDIHGKTLKSMRTQDSKGQIDLASMATGIYLLRVQNGNRPPITQKFLR